MASHFGHTDGDTLKLPRADGWLQRLCPKLPWLCCRISRCPLQLSGSVAAILQLCTSRICQWLSHGAKMQGISKAFVSESNHLCDHSLMLMMCRLVMASISPRMPSFSILLIARRHSGKGSCPSQPFKDHQRMVLRHRHKPA